MANTHVHEVTAEGLEKLKNELAKLKNEERPSIVKRMAAARELGDLSENADYHDAREQLSFVEGRIQELESMLKNARVISHRAGSGVVQIGSKVTVKINGSEATYEIVGANEGDPAAGKISSESPVGSALLGHKASETVEARTPGGSFSYQIVKIG